MSKRLLLPYGRSTIDANIDGFTLQGILTPLLNCDTIDEKETVSRACACPIDSLPLPGKVKKGQKIVVVTSDLTRPCPSRFILPFILKELAEAGIPEPDITIVIALGLHRPMTGAELEETVGSEICSRFHVVNHDPDQVIHLGETSFGTRVEIYKPIVEADFRICLGNVEFHYFAGFSGGAKAILPGCASAVTVKANHSLMVKSGARSGLIEGNPVRSDIEEGVAMLGVDYILNVVIDDDHRIVGAFAGDVTAAHRRGCEMVRQRGSIPISKVADVVLVGAGGYPKDINLYQAQKALDNAAHAVKQGGAIVLAAECREGLGNRNFERWLREASTPDDLLARLQASFELGGHKAAAIASVLKRSQVLLVSSLDDELVRTCGMIPHSDVNSALEEAIAGYKQPANLLVIPNGGAVLPSLAE
ncbi:MAG: nickel-dependent lactate racemase [Anaerolineales bacterium]|nr:nickel-dependent lactate racemase [Anaerolineales bacterium]